VTGFITSKACRPRPVARRDPLQARLDAKRALYDQREDWQAFNPAQWCRSMSADYLVTELANNLGLSFDATRDTLARLNPNMVHLFDSPQGWTMLAQYVSYMTDCGEREEHFKPVVQ
jgi:hypothetical protein